MIVYREAATLAQDLEIPAKTLYAVSNSLPAHYRRVSIPKRDGGVRQLLVPDEVLKHIQRQIAQKLLIFMEVSCCATAYRPGGGAVRNAACHVGRREILRLDIRHFFDSVRYTAVKEAAFPARIYAEPLRVLLTLLCYYGDGLPQGAPSSPAIANLVLRDFDRTMYGWCREREITYTRYCDDLTFSGDRSLEGVREKAAAELAAMGFFLHDGKTARRMAGQRQTVTGLVVNEKVSVPTETRRKLRQEMYFCRRFGVQQHLSRIGGGWDAAAYLDRLLGQTAYVLQADPTNAQARADRQWLLEARRQERT